MNLTGKKFGLLQVLGVVEGRCPQGTKRYACLCSCGGTKEVSTTLLTSGKVKSCGCLTHNMYPSHFITHGGGNHPLYSIWYNMIDRCQNPKTQSYPRYGGRGIQVCPEWKASFWAFVESMGVRPTPQHSVDRINNNGDYTPGNCRWATPSQQRRNSTGRMHNVEAFGHTMIVTDWAEAYFIPHAVLTGRLRMGWEAERALLTPYTPRTKSRP